MRVLQWHDQEIESDPGFEKFGDKQQGDRFIRRKMAKGSAVQFADSMCLGKAAFETFALADEIVKRKRPRRKGRHLIRIYRCRVCHQWHIAGVR